MQVMAHLLTDKVHELPVHSYADKAVVALLLEYGIKTLKPNTYMQYFATKSVSMPVAVACAIIHLFQHVPIADMYQHNVIRTVVSHIQPKLLPSV